MSASIFLDYDCDAIQAARAVTLLHFKNAHSLTYKDLGKVCQREPQSIQQYVCTDTEMPASCWQKLTAKWPELDERLIFNLDEAEKAFRAKQRELRLPAREPETRAA